MLSSNTMLDNKYQIIQEVTRDNTSILYMVRNHNDNLYYLRVLVAELVSDSTLNTLFAKSAKLVYVIRHSNLVEGVDVGLDDKIGSYYVMKEMSKWKRLSRREGVQIDCLSFIGLAQQCMEAVQVIHDRHLLHLGLTPSCIWIHDGLVKISEFELGHVRHYLSGTKQVLHHHYLSPEQLQTNEIDVRTDIFSLGVILQEILMGQMLVPFRQLELTKLRTNIISEQEVLPKIDSWLTKAQNPNPDKRYQTVEEMHTAFLSILPNVFTSSTTLVNLSNRAYREKNMNEADDANNQTLVGTGLRLTSHQSHPDLVMRCIEQAEQALANQEYRVAIRWLERALDIAPDEDRIIGQLASVRRERQKFLKTTLQQGKQALSADQVVPAIKLFEKLLDEEPDSDEVINLLATARRKHKEIQGMSFERTATRKYIEDKSQSQSHKLSFGLSLLLILLALTFVPVLWLRNPSLSTPNSSPNGASSIEVLPSVTSQVPTLSAIIPTATVSTPVTFVPIRLRVSAPNANLKQSPSLDTPTVRVLTQGTQLERIGVDDSGRWYQVRVSPSEEGWILFTDVVLASNP